MTKKMKKAVVGMFGVLCVLVLIAMIILGVNLIKNRWHKLNFIIDSFTAEKVVNDAGKSIYYVEVKGSVKTWFYDFNTYEFDLVNANSEESRPLKPSKSETIVADRNGSNEFTISFYTYDLDSISAYTFRGENIVIDGNSKEGTDIRLFLEEHLDELKTVN